MFEFIAKLIHKSVDNKKVVNAPEQSKQRTIVETKKRELEQSRQAYLQKIDAAAFNEASLIELLLTCDFADGRLHAAQYVASQLGLERVKREMLNSDKRVVKLMQSRLDSLLAQETLVSKGQSCIAGAEKLIQQDFILMNQLIDLDKEYASLNTLPQDLAEQFNNKRKQIDQQLTVQTNLQREVLAIMHKLDLAQDYSQANFADQLYIWQTEFDKCKLHPAAASIPKHVLLECQQKLDLRNVKWKQYQQEIKQHDYDLVMASQLLSQTSETDAANASKNQHLEIESARPQLPAENKPHSVLSAAQLEQAISGFEEALEAGSIQSARQFERELRDLDIKKSSGTILSPMQKDRLAQARKKLADLMSWAKWSGNVSREELISTAEGLATLSLSPKELVGTVAALRDQWKQMDATGGNANKEVWARFDAACSAAYAPAAKYFQDLSAQRSLNLKQAEALLTELRNQAYALLDGDRNWKTIAQTCQQMQLDWKRIGQVDRKEKVHLDVEFSQIFHGLHDPLEQRQNEEMASRHALIEEALKLDAGQRSAVDRIRQLQERWQKQATALPLRRKDEQALWEKFRLACDGIFSQRKQAAESADQQRQKNFEDKSALCERLETVDCSSGKAINKCIDECVIAWRNIGHVPRHREPEIDARFDLAMTNAKARLHQSEQEANRTAIQKMLIKIRLCQSAESRAASLSGSAADAADLQQAWQTAGVVSGRWNTILQERFDLALQAHNEGGQAYLQSLTNNVIKFDQSMLHLEILSGLESPSELSRERLQKQVEVLQAAMRSGNDALQIRHLLNELLCLPVSLDAARQGRLDKVLEKLAHTLLA